MTLGAAIDSYRNDLHERHYSVADMQRKQNLLRRWLSYAVALHQPGLPSRHAPLAQQAAPALEPWSPETRDRNSFSHLQLAALSRVASFPASMPTTIAPVIFSRAATGSSARSAISLWRCSCNPSATARVAQRDGA